VVGSASAMEVTSVGRGVVGFFHGLFDGAGDEVAGAEADGEREGEDDAAEEDAEGELDDATADVEVVEGHGGAEYKDEPLDAEREEAGVLELGVDGADEDRAREEAREQAAGEQDEHGSGEVRDVGQKEDGVLRVGGVRGVKRGDADGDAGEEADPEGDARGEQGGGVGGGPVGEDGGRAGGFAGGEALVKAQRGEDAAQEHGESPADEREDDEREQKGQDAGQEAREHKDNSVDGLAESGDDLLFHDGFLWWYEKLTKLRAANRLAFEAKAKTNAGPSLRSRMTAKNSCNSNLRGEALEGCSNYGLKRSGQRQRETM
jgi:hypothetical protein